MTCEKSAVLLHALLDGELDAGHTQEVEAHVAGCTRCSAQLAVLRDLRQALKDRALGYSAPVSLRSGIDRVLPSSAPALSRRSMLRGFAWGSLSTAVAAAGVTFVIARQGNDNSLLGDVVSAHLRSLQADHLTDVLSSSEHTVKPWFNGRIDLAPPVPNLAAQGFTLIGGRLDYIDGKPVAAIVYRRRAHVINLFVAQDLGPQLPSTPRLTIVQGFNILRWAEQGLDLTAVSDLNRRELGEFVAKFKSATLTADVQ
ncbi:MAG TPA: anti-sigma factor [Pseudolabrys sp.]|jgi:anti-sigma factor RsiW|nr:anti-sigma factor [Pseudolabrys sp.]